MIVHVRQKWWISSAIFSPKAVKTRPRKFILSRKVYFEEKEKHDNLPAVLTDQKHKNSTERKVSHPQLYKNLQDGKKNPENNSADQRHTDFSLSV